MRNANNATMEPYKNAMLLDPVASKLRVTPATANAMAAEKVLPDDRRLHMPIARRDENPRARTITGDRTSRSVAIGTPIMKTANAPSRYQKLLFKIDSPMQGEV
jgi:hypothetical protein